MPLSFFDLGKNPLLAFQRNHRTSFLEESIYLLQRVLKTPSTQGQTRPFVLEVLRRCFFFEGWKFLPHGEDLDEALLVLGMCIDNK